MRIVELKRKKINMPIFDFTCADCKRDFEKLIHTTVEEEGTKCPFCGGTVRKLFPTTRPANFRLKGKGWTGSNIIPIVKEK